MNWGERLVGTASGVLVILLFVVIVGPQLLLASPIVREYCLDFDESEAAGEVAVDSSWTYIIWPPLYLAPLDPPGRCVRNSPFRELLDVTGIWGLESPEEQVQDHVQEQLGTAGSRRTDGGAATPTERTRTPQMTTVSEEFNTRLSLRPYST